VGALRDETEAFVVFNESYSYFRQNWLFKKVVRAALRTRLYIRLLEHHLRADKTVVKGPVAVYGRRRAEPMAVRSSEEF